MAACSIAGAPSLWCGGEAVASHHFGDRCGVGWTACCSLEDLGHLAEVVRAEDAGGDDREHRRVDLVIVVEAVDDSPRYAQYIALAYVDLLSVKRPGQHAL